MEPRRSINEIIDALKHPPKTRSGEEAVSLESYYKGWAEAAVEVLVGAEAAMGQWQDVLARTRDELEDAQQRLVDAAVAHAITQHRVGTQVEVTQYWEWRGPDAAFDDAIYPLLLRLHSLLAARRVIKGKDMDDKHLCLLEQTRHALDNCRAALGHSTRSLIDSDEDDGIMSPAKTGKARGKKPAGLKEKHNA